MLYRISQQKITRFLKFLELYGFAFSALAIDKTFTQHNFLASMNEIVSICSPIKS